MIPTTTTDKQATKEAVRHLRDSQELWENYLTCAARLAKPSDVIYAFHRLLDLRARHKASMAGGKVGMCGMAVMCVRSVLDASL